MGSLLYRPDWLEARDRLTTWWNGGDIGRPIFQISVPRAEPWEEIEALPEPEGWITHYSTTDPAYRLNLALRTCLGTQYLGEAVPTVASGDLAPNCLALYLGCHGVEMPDTVWCEPFMDDPAAARFEYDPDNFYWRFTLDQCAQTLVLGRGKFLHAYPDLIEGLDTLAAMRGTDRLLIDLLERPDWVHGCLRQITDVYFHYYDILYDLFRDEVGGSWWWAYAPGRMAKFQCDFSAMISAPMFREFMVPVLTEMTERVSYSMYHWDGPGAIQHLDALLSVPKLNMIQWTPGAGAEPTWHERWWPLYHRIFDAGKSVLLGADNVEQLLALKREFGEQCKQMLIGTWAPTVEEAEAQIKAMEF
jgi:hypothetical protein